MVRNSEICGEYPIFKNTHVPLRTILKCRSLTHAASDFLYNEIAIGYGLPGGKSGGNLTTSYTESASEFPGETSLWHSEW
jgi:hypothetical protein